MKKLGGVISVLAVLGLAYTGFWFYQSNKIKNLVIDHLKEYEKPDADGYHLVVKNVSVDGFPFNYEVNLHQPTYELVEKNEGQLPALQMDGSIKIGTDLLGRAYWLKKEGDVNVFTVDNKNIAQSYVVKGNSDLKVHVNNPQQWQAFLHPFAGLPADLYKQDASFEDFYNEIKSAAYFDKDFGLYAKNGTELKQLAAFSKANMNWTHTPSEAEENFGFDFNIQDLQAMNEPQLKQLLDANSSYDVNLPYIVGAGKNTIDLDFSANLPKNLNDLSFSNYKNASIVLKDFNIHNQYGNTQGKFDLSLANKGEDERNLHVGLDTNSEVTPTGSEAMHRQFMESLKAQAIQADDSPESKLLVELLNCCQDKLEAFIPDYTKLGKMQFLVDSNLKVVNAEGHPDLRKIEVKDINLVSSPYAINSHGQFDLEKEPEGQYVFEWVNYKEMIHDLIAYFNRVHPVLEKIAESHKQPMHVGIINEQQESEIVDFFNSLADNHDGKDIQITVDYKESDGIRIGKNTIENVLQAWNKLKSDLIVKDVPAKPAAVTKDIPKPLVPAEKS